MSFKCQIDVTTSKAMTDVILQWQLISVRFPHALKSVNVVSYYITQFYSIGYIDKVSLCV